MNGFRGSRTVKGVGLPKIRYQPIWRAQGFVSIERVSGTATLNLKEGRLARLSGNRYNLNLEGDRYRLEI